ncbi:MAG TPA: TPM domain-containing protein [Gallionella sp.]|nr:TPM domain-containing protein [Gallionella sp.]
MRLGRIIRHLSTGRAAVRQLFPPRTLGAIERAIRETEAQHNGQIRFAVEASLELAPLLADQSARSRAEEVFAQLRVWDTEHNNGVLIYLLLADRDVEIIADRGVHAKLGQPVWEEICQEMEAAFRQGKFEEGVLAGIRSVGQHLAHHYPHAGEKINELPDRPVLLGG